MFEIGPARVALVFGGAKGVGAEVCRGLLQQGAAAVVAADIDQQALARLPTQISGDGRLHTRACDVRSWEAVSDVVRSVEGELGRVDILVNNAGIPPERVMRSMADATLFVDTFPNDWEPWFGVNLYGAAYTMRAVLPGMIERRYGRIVNCVSESAREGMAGAAAYAAAKAGVAGLSRAVSSEVARHGITVNCVSLGMTRTPTAMEMSFTESQMKAVLRRYHTGRLGESCDVAPAIVFLCSEEARWITAQTFPVNGGFSSAL